MSRNVRPVIPMRDNEHVKDRDRWPRLIKAAYRRRFVVERCVAKLKVFRRFASRYEKLIEFADTGRRVVAGGLRPCLRA